jgi:hypothetical protein
VRHHHQPTITHGYNDDADDAPASAGGHQAPIHGPPPCPSPPTTTSTTTISILTANPEDTTPATTTAISHTDNDDAPASVGSHQMTTRTASEGVMGMGRTGRTTATIATARQTATIALSVTTTCYDAEHKSRYVPLCTPIRLRLMRARGLGRSTSLVCACCGARPDSWC